MATIFKEASMKWIHKLDYKYGKHYIRNLMRYIVLGMVLVFVVSIAFPNLNIIYWLRLDRTAILSGQIWRLVTFIFIPDTSSALFAIITFVFYYSIGNTLESIWGGFRLNLFYLIGIIGTILSCFISPSGLASNSYLNLSLFLAFATLAPESTIMLLILPVKAKWLGIAYAVITLLEVISSFITSPLYGLSSLITVVLSLLGYLLFFGPQLIEIIKNEIRIIRNRRQWRGK